MTMFHRNCRIALTIDSYEDGVHTLDESSLKVDGHLERLMLRRLLEGCVRRIPLGIWEVYHG